MRRTWCAIPALGIMLLGSLGCQHRYSRPPIEAPKLHEEYTVPPPEDGRYSRPMEYPKEVLNQGLSKPTESSLPTPPMKAPSRFGAGPGMPSGRGF
ncbi:MAG: hypothetical protein NZ700_14405 [Gemmataceae bacterium]|nr:hypothetical protein [Gemmataceae bacterium]MDW8265823.1 hypothetical protein [Gemmataceae bacterium]